MKYGSVCSGIEAPAVAWKPLGWEAAWFSEIEPFPCAVLHHHYGSGNPINKPHPKKRYDRRIKQIGPIPNLGDITQITEAQLDECGPIDLLVGGTPCQSFSVAGLRKGLADPRGNLALRFLQLARATRSAWVLWENVPGVLSSGKGRDFGTFLGALAELGYGWAYRILDAQYFGVPQRRRRVFVVGHLGDWRRAAAVLFERESLCGYPSPSQKAGAKTAHCLAKGACGSHGRYDPNGEDYVVAVHTTGAGFWQEGVGTLRGREQESHEHLITHSLRGEGFDASEDGTGRGTPIIAYRTSGNSGVMEQGDKTAALNCGTDPNQTIVTYSQIREETRGVSMAVRRLTPL